MSMTVNIPRNLHWSRANPLLVFRVHGCRYAAYCYGLVKADMDTRQASPGAVLQQGSLQPFRPAQPRTSPEERMRPGLQAWPATGGAVIAPLQIARASAQDLDTVLGLIEDARSWLWSKDTDQWDKPWPDHAARDERVLAGLRNQKTGIVRDGDIAAATITITTRRKNGAWSKPACTAGVA